MAVLTLCGQCIIWPLLQYLAHLHVEPLPRPLLLLFPLQKESYTFWYFLKILFSPSNLPQRYPNADTVYTLQYFSIRTHRTKCMEVASMPVCMIPGCFLEHSFLVVIGHPHISDDSKSTSVPQYQKQSFWSTYSWGNILLLFHQKRSRNWSWIQHPSKTGLKLVCI